MLDTSLYSRLLRTQFSPALPCPTPLNPRDNVFAADAVDLDILPTFTRFTSLPITAADPVSTNKLSVSSRAKWQVLLLQPSSNLDASENVAHSYLPNPQPVQLRSLLVHTCSDLTVYFGTCLDADGSAALKVL